MPTCTQCITRGIECGYNKPIRKGRKVATQNLRRSPEQGVVTTFTAFGDQEYPNHESPTETTKHLTQQHVLDMYYDALACFTNVKAIERTELESYLNHLDSDLSYYLNSLYFSIRALCEQRCGMMDAAEESMLFSRTALGNVFYDHSNFFVVCTYCYLSLYESGCGRLKSARFYMELVKFYYSELVKENRPEKVEEMRNLNRMLSAVEMNCQHDHGILASLKKWPESFERLVGVPLPEEWRQVLTQDITLFNYKSVLNIIDMLAQLGHQLKGIHGYSEQVLKLHDMTFPLILNGLRIEILELVNCDAEIKEECALSVTRQTENELFSYAPSGVVPFVVAAAKVHLNIVKSIEKDERMHPTSCFVRSSTNDYVPILVDYFDILQKDLKALQVLSKRYKKVTLFHSELLDDITTTLHRRLLANHLDQQQEQITSALTTSSADDASLFDLPYLTSMEMKDMFTFF